MATENNWLKKELRKIENTRKGLIDKYNTLDEPVDINDIKHILNSNLQYTPKEGQTWESYISELQIYINYNRSKSEKNHINGPKGPWYTHRSPSGCFMCDDMKLIQVMFNTMKLMVSQYPDTKY